MMTTPYPTPIATIAPNVTADVAVETGVTKVAAKGAMSNGANQPKRYPAPAMTPVHASSAAHHQSRAQAVNATPRPVLVMVS